MTNTVSVKLKTAFDLQAAKATTIWHHLWLKSCVYIWNDVVAQVTLNNKMKFTSSSQWKWMRRSIIKDHWKYTCKTCHSSYIYVCGCVCVCVCAYAAYVCICIYVYICVCIFPVYICKCICMVCLGMCLSTCTCICV